MAHARDTSSFDWNLLDFMSRYRNRNCRDPRDKVYALAGLASGPYAGLIEPDYTKEATKVFEDVAARILERPAPIGLWNFITPSQLQAYHHRPSQKIPSWAPDWRIEERWSGLVIRHDRSIILPLYSASGSSLSSARHLGSGMLAVRVTIVANIAEIGEATVQLFNRRNLYTQLSKWRRMAEVDVNAHQSYPRLAANLSPTAPARKMKPLEYLDAYILTICGGASQEVMIDKNAPPNSGFGLIRDLKACRAIHGSWWEWISGSNPNDQRIKEVSGTGLKTMDYFNKSVMRTMSMRCLFVTEGEVGFIGAAPESARPKDAVAIIEGSSAPIILRRVADDDLDGLDKGKTWRVVGDAYVQGIMHGEGLSLGTAEEIVLI